MEFLISREVNYNYKCLYLKIKASEKLNIHVVLQSSNGDWKSFLLLILYLSKCLWSTPQLLFVEHLFVACCVYRLWLFSLRARFSLGTVLISMKPEVCCTSVGSAVSLFIGVEKKMWPITIESIDDQHGFSHLLHSAPKLLLNETSHITRGSPKLTTD